MKSLPRTRFFSIKLPDKYKVLEIMRFSDMTKSEKIRLIRGKKPLFWTCPGCLEEYDVGASKINRIQACHIHSVKCYRHEASRLFWACASCNFCQGSKCGYFDKGQFIPLCKARSEDPTRPSEQYEYVRVYLRKDQVRALKKAATQAGLSLSEHFRQLLDAHMDIIKHGAAM